MDYLAIMTLLLSVEVIDGLVLVNTECDFTFFISNRLLLTIYRNLTAIWQLFDSFLNLHLDRRWHADEARFTKSVINDAATISIIAIIGPRILYLHKLCLLKRLLHPFIL